MGDIEDIRRWRDELTITPEIEGGIQHGWSRDVDVLLREIDRLAAIVRDLAAAAGFDECVFCPATTGRLADHEPSCPYGRAVEWVEAQSDEGGG
jgi:hypothetical protein